MVWRACGKGESVLTAAKRELLEESGLVADKLIFCGQVLVDTGLDRGIIFLSSRQNNSKVN